VPTGSKWTVLRSLLLRATAPVSNAAVDPYVGPKRARFRFPMGDELLDSTTLDLISKKMERSTV
jgi:hypothetical protein